jgi:uncharacterized membrane protein (UPF0136 family)
MKEDEEKIIRDWERNWEKIEREIYEVAVRNNLDPNDLIRRLDLRPEAYMKEEENKYIKKVFDFLKRRNRWLKIGAYAIGTIGTALLIYKLYTTPDIIFDTYIIDKVGESMPPFKEVVSEHVASLLESKGIKLPLKITLIKPIFASIVGYLLGSAIGYYFGKKGSKWTIPGIISISIGFVNAFLTHFYLILHPQIDIIKAMRSSSEYFQYVPPIIERLLNPNKAVLPLISPTIGAMLSYYIYIRKNKNRRIKEIEES